MNSLIQIENLYKTYEMGGEKIHALNGLNLHIEKGEYIALMGPSGSGKSTLMNIISCLDTPSSGKYILNQQEVNLFTENQLAQFRNAEIGFVFQTFNLLPRLNGIENVALPLIYAGIVKKEREERALITLKSVGLENRALHKPNELSGGQRQRIAIARALVNNPSILLADEPTGNLDSKTSLEIMELFEQLHKKGITIIMVTHEEDIAKHAQRKIRIKDGKIDTD